MSELFYFIESQRYDSEDGPRDCQILRLFKDKGHYEIWRRDIEAARPIDTVECEGGRVCEETQRYLEWSALDDDAAWNLHATQQDIMGSFDSVLKEA